MHTDKTSDTTSNEMSFAMALYIFLPMILLLLIIIILLVLRRNKASDINSPREKNNRETEQQQYDEQSFTENEGYTDLDEVREPDNTYATLYQYEDPDCISVRPNVIANQYNDHNEHVKGMSEAEGSQRRCSYVIPPSYNEDNYDIPNNN